jgi:predicted Rdx family selenoprotein
VVGNSGEFTVWVDDKQIIGKRQGKFPEPREIVDAVRALVT